ASNVKRPAADYCANIEFPFLISRSRVSLGICDIPSNVPVRVCLRDDISYRPLAMKLHGDLFQVFKAAAEQEPACESAPKSYRCSRKSLMPAAGFSYQKCSHSRHASKLIVCGCRMHKFILIQTRCPFVLRQ